MRKTFLALGVVAATLVAAPAAQASRHHDHVTVFRGHATNTQRQFKHHLDQDTSDAVCVLVSNVPTFQVTAHYVDFSAWDQPVTWAASIDTATVGGGSLSWVGPDYTHTPAFATTPGTHTLIYQSSWNDGENGGYIKRTRTCPAPVPPPVIVTTPPPTTPPPVYYDCAGHQMPPGSTPAICVPPKKTKKPCKCTPPPKLTAHCPIIRLAIPTAHHGVVDFGGRCSKGKIVDTTMYVIPTGPRGGDMTHGRRIVCGTAKLHAKGAIIHGVWLYDQTIFCHREAWGSYSLIFVFKVRYHGHVYRCTKRAKFVDNDPNGLPS